MLISFPFLPASGNGSADSFEQAALTVTTSLDDYESPHGIYPVSLDRRWHGGVHLTPKFVDEPVRAIADGTVIAYRVTSDCAVEGHDNSFILLKHETETGHERSITFYSLYMHLMNHKDMEGKRTLMKQLAPPMQESTGEARHDGKTKVFRKDIIGYPGKMYGQRMIHFEIFMTDVDFNVHFDKTLLGKMPVESDGSAEPWGNAYYVIPPRSFRVKPSEQSDVTGTSDKTLFVRIAYESGTKYTTVWAADSLDHPPKLITPEKGAPEPEYEYSLFKTASESYPACPSAGYELLRFGRVIGPDKGKLPAEQNVNWQRIPFAPGQSEYVDLNLPNIRKMSDADFPFFTGWAKATEGNGALSDDGLCDVKVILDILRDASTPTPRPDVDRQERLALYLCHDEEARRKLRGLICEAPTEWDKSTNVRRYRTLTNPGEHYANDPAGLKKFVDFVEKFQFWDMTGLPSKIWHFHPLAFVEHFKKCGWLSRPEMAQLLPVSAMRLHKGAYVSERVDINVPARQRVLSDFRVDLNKALRKHGIVTANRMAAFFGNAMQETQWFGKLYEDNSVAWYFPWDGRGFLQLTGPGNYIKYWRWRGRDVAAAVEQPLVSAYSKKDHAALQDRANPKVTSEMIEWRNDVSGLKDNTRYDSSDSAGAYWAWSGAARFADFPSSNDRATKRIGSDTHVYYACQSFGQVAATVNFGSPVTNLASIDKVNGIVARYQAYTSALKVLADTPQFPDQDGKLQTTPEGYERRKEIP